MRITVTRVSRTGSALLPAAVALALVLSGCGRDDATDAQSSASTTTPSAVPAAPTPAQGGAPATAVAPTPPLVDTSTSGDASPSVDASTGSSDDGRAWWEDCHAVWNARAAPILRGETGYGTHLDPDGDGKACEIGGEFDTDDNGGTTFGSSYGSSGPAASGSSGGSGPVPYRNCADVRARGAAPIPSGKAGYAPHLDGDGDGIGCE